VPGGVDLSVSKTRLGWTALPILLVWPGASLAAQTQPAEARPSDEFAAAAAEPTTPVTPVAAATPAETADRIYLLTREGLAPQA